MNRRRLAGLLLAAWGLALGWLVVRQYSRSTGARLANAALAIPPGATYYRLVAGDEPIGFASTTLDTLADSIRVDDVLVLDAAALGRLHRTTTRSTAILSRTLRLRSLTVAFDGDDGRFDARGAVYEDTVLRLKLVTASDSDGTRSPVSPTAVVPSVLPLRLAFGGELRVGDRHTMRVFDPVSLSERAAVFRVQAETTMIVSDSAAYDSVARAWVAVLWDTVDAFRLDAEENEGATRRVWIDDDGQIVRSEAPGGVVTERAAFEIAYENFRHRDTAALARASATPAQGSIVPATALAAGVLTKGEQMREGLRVRITGGGADLNALSLAGVGQEIHGDTIVVRRAEPAALTARYGVPLLDTAFAEWLRPDALAQSNNSFIEAQARQIIGRERIASRATGMILAWTSALQRTPAPGVPSAVRTLRVRSGDCNELTVLFVALARAIGLPARPVSGLLLRDGRFYYHAWAEVYLGDWVPVDPMLGQLPASGDRVRFVTGGLGRRVDLLRQVGTLTLETP